MDPLKSFEDDMNQAFRKLASDIIPTDETAKNLCTTKVSFALQFWNDFPVTYSHPTHIFRLWNCYKRKANSKLARFALLEVVVNERQYSVRTLTACYSSTKYYPRSRKFWGTSMTSSRWPTHSALEKFEPPNTPFNSKRMISISTYNQQPTFSPIAKMKPAIIWVTNSIAELWTSSKEIRTSLDICIQARWQRQPFSLWKNRTDSLMKWFG